MYGMVNDREDLLFRVAYLIFFYSRVYLQFGEKFILIKKERSQRTFFYICFPILGEKLFLLRNVTCTCIMDNRLPYDVGATFQI